MTNERETITLKELLLLEAGRILGREGRTIPEEDVSAIRQYGDECSVSPEEVTFYLYGRVFIPSRHLNEVVIPEGWNRGGTVIGRTEALHLPMGDKTYTLAANPLDKGSVASTKIKYERETQ